MTYFVGVLRASSVVCFPLEVNMRPRPRKVIEWLHKVQRLMAVWGDQGTPGAHGVANSTRGNRAHGAHATLHCGREGEVCAKGTTVPSGGRSLP